ncbi:HNH endonuclease signature motif containing protein [Gordonia sinesedis]
MNLPDLVDPLTEHTVDDAASGREVFEATQALLMLRNLVDHQLSAHVAALDRLGVATQHGRSLRELLIVMGCAPVVAQRLLRIAGSLDAFPMVARHAADGAMSAEHHDAVARGMAQIDRRTVEPIDDEVRRKCMTSLIAQVMSGASPAEVQQHARTLGNELAAASDGSVLPAAEDRRMNSVTVAQDGHGRVQVRADVDVVTGEKLSAAIDNLSAPRPEPDGSRDARSAEQRRADALDHILDVAARGGGLDGTGTATAPTTQVALTIPADTPSLAGLEFTGSVTRETARLLSCDATVTVMIVDGEEVPMDVGRQHRLFTAAMRTALHLRDRGCIKCGAPASWTHAHHMRHWADGGETCLDNGCLLCPGCHDDIHHHGWEVFLGHDRHPWLIPPETVDPRRRPIPAHNRRRPHLDDLPAAA